MQTTHTVKNASCISLTLLTSVLCSMLESNCSRTASKVSQLHSSFQTFAGLCQSVRQFQALAFLYSSKPAGLSVSVSSFWMIPVCSQKSNSVTPISEPRDRQLFCISESMSVTVHYGEYLSLPIHLLTLASILEDVYNVLSMLQGVISVSQIVVTGKLAKDFEQ